MSKSTLDTGTKNNNRVALLGAGTMLQNRYRIIRELGSGGMGAVYEAIDQRLEATVAIKETFSADDRLRRQFEQEARLLAQLHHPSLPRVSDYFKEDGRAFLVMQFIAGHDLAEVISRQAGPFPGHQVIAWADQLLDALIYLHTRDRQIIHRDIKPHNLKLTESGQIALLDFGLAKTHGGDHSTTQSSNSVFGYTRRYSPLEQIQDQGTSPRSDIYALGATLYHLLTGVKPPDALVRAAALANSKSDPLKSASEINPAVGGGIAGVLNKAMALNASDRFECALEFREALRRLGRQAFELSGDAVLNTSVSNNAVVHTTVVAKPPRKSDPFDSYSILRPQPELFQSPKPKRGPAIFVAAVAIILITVAASYPSGLNDYVARLLNYARATQPREAASATALRQGKTDVMSSSTEMVKDSSVTLPAEPNRKNETQRRRGLRQGASKPPAVKPPPISIAP